MRPLERLRILALACAALTAAPAWAAPAASRFEGASWIAPPADSAGFGAARRALAELERASDPASGPRVAVPVRLARARAADSVAARFGAQLASRAGADSVAIAQLQLLRHQLRLPVFGMSNSVTRTLLAKAPRCSNAASAPTTRAWRPRWPSSPRGTSACRTRAAGSQRSIWAGTVAAATWH